MVLRAAMLAMPVAGLAAGTAGAQERLYVLTGGNTAVIDPSTNTQVGTVIPAMLFPIDIAASPDGRRVYITNNTDVDVVDAGGNFVFTTLPMAQGSGALAADPKGKFLYAVTPFGPNLTVIDAGFIPEVVRSLFLNMVAGDIAVSPNGRSLYITDVFNGSLRVLSTSNFRYFDIPVGPFPTSVAAHPDGARVYVVHQSGGGQVTVTNFAAGTIGTLSVPDAFDLAVAPDGSRVYVSKAGSDAVAVIDTATESVVATVPVGDDPRGMAVSANGAFVYVANQLSGTVSVISTATNTVTATINVGGSPFALAYVTPRGPASKHGCMNGGWQTFTNPSFQTQGECIAFYNSIH